VGGVTELAEDRVIIPFRRRFRTLPAFIHHELTHAVVNDMFIGGRINRYSPGGGMEIPDV